MRKAQQTRSLIAAWFDFMPQSELSVAQKIYRAIRAMTPDLSETIRQGNLLFSLNGEPLLAIAPVRGQVHLLVFNGSETEVITGPLEGIGRRQRMLRFTSGHPIDFARVELVVRSSMEVAYRQQHQQQQQYPAPDLD